MTGDLHPCRPSEALLGLYGQDPAHPALDITILVSRGSESLLQSMEGDRHC